MTTVEIKSKVTFNDLLQGVEQLNPIDLEKFVEKVMLIRAKQFLPNVKDKEAILLEKLKTIVPEGLRKRFAALTIKMEDETMTKEEHIEMTSLVEQMEELDNQRLLILIELSKIRNVSIDELMKDLKIAPQPNE